MSREIRRYGAGSPTPVSPLEVQPPTPGRLSQAGGLKGPRDASGSATRDMTIVSAALRTGGPGIPVPGDEARFVSLLSSSG